MQFRVKLHHLVFDNKKNIVTLPELRGMVETIVNPISRNKLDNTIYGCIIKYNSETNIISLELINIYDNENGTMLFYPVDNPYEHTGKLEEYAKGDLPFIVGRMINDVIEYEKEYYPDHVAFQPDNACEYIYLDMEIFNPDN